jgi:hypothetical protein
MDYRAQPESSLRDAREEHMLKGMLKSMFGKAALAAVVLGGALSFVGASNAQAAERVVVRGYGYHGYGYRGPVIRRGGPVYLHGGPRVVVRGWYDRFGCWHRY